MGSTWGAWALVLGWIPMLLGVLPPKRRPAAARDAGLRPGVRAPDEEVERSDRGREASSRRAGRAPSLEERGRPDEFVPDAPAWREPGREARGMPSSEPGEPRPRGLGAERRRPGPEMPRFDRMLLLLTWLGCAALTAVALWNSIHKPGPTRVAAGVLVFWGGIALWIWGRAALADQFTQTTRVPRSLVTRGPFRYVRHPLYLATTIACLGQALAGGSWVTFALWVCIVAVLSLRARREELLLRRFGTVWADYARRTPRILL